MVQVDKYVTVNTQIPTYQVEPYATELLLTIIWGGLQAFQISRCDRVMFRARGDKVTCFNHIFPYIKQQWFAHICCNVLTMIDFHFFLIPS